MYKTDRRGGGGPKIVLWEYTELDITLIIINKNVNSKGDFMLRTVHHLRISFKTN